MLALLAYFLAVAGILVFLVVPGYAWLRAAGLGPVDALYVGPLVSMLAAAAVAAIGTVLPWSQGVTATTALVLIALSVVVILRRLDGPRFPRGRVWAGIVVWAVLFLGLAAYLGVPARAWFAGEPWTITPGRIETPRLPGGPSDSYLPYRTGQLVANKEGGDALTTSYHPGWWISDRAPLSGLVFAFAASAAHVDVPPRDLITLPASEDRGTFVDAYGYWFYQLVAAAIGAAGVLGVFLLGREWFGHRVALIATVLFAMMPGIFVYSIYPRPALVMVYPALVALALVRRRHYWLAGVGIGACYLAHPTGAVWGLGAVVAAWSLTRNRRDTIEAAVRVAVPAGLLALPWLAFNSLVVRGSSRFLAWPLGAKLDDPRQPVQGLRTAWDALVEKGLWTAGWVRLEALLRSIVPGQLIPPFPAADQPLYLWGGVHALGGWGLGGLVLFPAAVASVFVLSSGDRRFVLSVAIVVLAANLAIEGYPESFFYQSLLPVLGLLALCLAAWMVTWRHRTQLVVVGLAALELASVVWTGAFFHPYDIPAGQLAVLVIVALASQLALLALLLDALASGGSRVAREPVAPPVPEVTG